MNPRAYHLLERLQRIDERLRLARTARRINPLEVLRLSALRQILRTRLARMARPLPAAG